MFLTSTTQDAMMSTLPAGFTCATCGAWHDDLPLDLAIKAPSAWCDDLPGRLPSSLLTDDVCVIEYDDGQVDRFVRGILALPIVGTDTEFRYGTWASLSEGSLERYRALWDVEDADESPWFGWHACRLDYAPTTLNLQVAVIPQRGHSRPRFKMAPSDHPLAAEQRDGITIERLVEIVTRFVDHTAN